MGLTSALFTGLSGLNTNQFRIDTIGDNIANANTTGFKGSRSMFQTQFAQVVTLGTPPSANQGGSNGIEVGLGSMVGATQRNMQQGSTETTGLATDMAIDGNGFFVVRSSDVRQAYTRDGSFLLNADNCLVTADGYYLQGFGVDQNFKVVPGVMSDLKIPLGLTSQSRATDSVKLSGNLSSSNALIGSQGSLFRSQALVSDAAGTIATGATALTAVRSATAAGTPLFANGDVITVSGVKKGGRDVPAAQFVVGTTGTTVSDYMNWLNSSLGINTNTAVGVPGSPGASIDAAGRITVTGNVGTENALVMPADAIQNGSGSIPITMADSGQKAIGQSVYTSFTAYDSLGKPIQVNVTMVLESQATGGNTWRFYAESPDSKSGRTVGTGTATFDQSGNITSTTPLSINIDRSNTGAATPLTIDMDLSAVTGQSTAGSSLVMTGQNGFPPGTLNAFSIGADGTITGTFTNGLSRTLGQVSLATFSNPAGLTRETNNVFRSGPNSGDAVVSVPGDMGAGQVMSGALELSNVDLSREFIGLINASTGFSAAGKVITTSDKLLNDLLMLTQ
jgi:flagellar hook protein FlgE